MDKRICTEKTPFARSHLTPNTGTLQNSALCLESLGEMMHAYPKDGVCVVYISGGPPIISWAATTPTDYSSTRGGSSHVIRWHTTPGSLFDFT
jgi:hypothetical protein